MTEYPVLAIDYGEKHFGLAYSDTKGLLATPLEVLTKGRRTSTENIVDQILERDLVNWSTFKDLYVNHKKASKLYT